MKTLDISRVEQNSVRKACFESTQSNSDHTLSTELAAAAAAAAAGSGGGGGLMPPGVDSTPPSHSGRPPLDHDGGGSPESCSGNDNNNSSNSKQKRHRTRFTPAQVSQQRCCSAIHLHTLRLQAIFWRV